MDERGKQGCYLYCGTSRSRFCKRKSVNYGVGAQWRTWASSMGKRIIGWLFATVVASAFISPALALEKYFCVADQSVGFKWDGSHWEIAKFNVDDDKFIVREVTKQVIAGNKFNYEVVKLGQGKARRGTACVLLLHLRSRVGAV
jgi:hypothetical protein